MNIIRPIIKFLASIIVALVILSFALFLLPVLLAFIIIGGSFMIVFEDPENVIVLAVSASVILGMIGELYYVFCVLKFFGVV